jgi:hypothetical protein
MQVRARSAWFTVAALALFVPLPAVAQSHGKAWENVVIDNKTGYWRVFTYWKTPRLLCEDGSFRPVLEPFSRHKHKKPSDRKPVHHATTPPPKGWTKPDFDHSAWPRQHGTYGPAPSRKATEWAPGGPTDLATLCLRGKFLVKKPDAVKDLQMVLEYHGGVAVYINGKEIKRAHLPMGKMKPGVTLAESYGRDAYVPKRFKRIETVRLRSTRVLIKPRMVRKGVNVVAVGVYRAPVREILADQPRDRKGLARLELWPHAWVKRATLHSGWGLTPKSAVASIDEPQVRKKPAGRDILNTKQSYWRTFTRWKTVEMVAEDGRLVALKEPPGRNEGYGSGKPRAVYATTPPSDGWTDPGFDDSEWARVRGWIGPGWGYSSVWGPGNPAALKLLYARGKFHVVEPTKCKGLRVMLEYRGGVVVYVNGRELTRKHLPKGEIDHDTHAEPYKRAAYVKAGGTLLHPGYDLKNFADHIRLYQIRTLDAEIPAGMLRKGVNVVAIEVHRAPVNEVLLTGRYHKLRAGRIPGPWPHACLMEAALRTTRGETPESSVEPNLGRPEGAQVWNSRVVRRIDRWDYGNPCETLHAIRIVGARGGSFCGHVAFGCTDPVEEFRAAISDLKSGNAAIPASSAEVFYETQEGRSFAWGNSGRFETLWPEPPAVLRPSIKYHGNVQPVWIKVRVPRDATPGRYEGVLTLRYQRGIRGINLKPQEPIEVPVVLTVHEWTLPRPQEYRTFIDLIQSPETVAIRYGVPMWSPEHLKYMRASFRLLAETGNKSVYLRLINRSHFGNSESIVRFVRDKGGRLEPDFTNLHKYMKLAVDTQGKPEVVILYFWENYVGSNRGRGERQAPLATEYDPTTGKCKEIELPTYCTPEGETFWSRYVAALRKELARYGLGKELMIGTVSDWNRPTKTETGFFKKVAPGMPWVEHCHGLMGHLSGRARVGYSTTVWNARGPHDPRYKHPRLGYRAYGWRKDWLTCQFHRDLRRPSRNLFMYRNAAEWNIAGHQRGLGRFGGDFWNVLKRGEKVVKDSRHSAGHTIVHRYPDHSAWAQLVVRTGFLACGPDGALPSLHFEMLREGVQNCEARIFIEKALLNPDRRTKLGKKLADRAKRVLDERTWMLAGASQYAPWFFDTGFTERQHRLYRTAAEVAAAIGQGGR